MGTALPRLCHRGRTTEHGDSREGVSGGKEQAGVPELVPAEMGQGRVVV